MFGYPQLDFTFELAELLPSMVELEPPSGSGTLGHENTLSASVSER
jgi:hypothetical protein